MPPEQKAEVTELLHKWSAGSQEALNELVPLVHAELRQLAQAYLARERDGHTLQPTALVNEAYLRLVDQRVSWSNRSHFFGVAAQCMRRILVDHARRRRASKRGAASSHVDLDEAMVAANWGAPDSLIALDLALDRIARDNPRCAKLAELHYFGGLTVDETAAITNVSPSTVKRELRTARDSDRRRAGRG